jgi:hypothetical protein
MRRVITVFLSILVVAGLTATVALAASVHLKGGKNAKPSFTDNGVSLTASGAISGLGNGDITVTLTATADVTSTCTNQGGNEAPGQNPAPITVSGSEAIPAGSIINGNVGFDVTTEEPVLVIPGAPDCPNSNWTESIDDLAFTSATIVVRQPDTDGTGPIVLTVSCSFSPATSDGPVPNGNVSCTQS